MDSPVHVFFTGFHVDTAHKQLSGTITVKLKAANGTEPAFLQDEPLLITLVPMKDAAIVLDDFHRVPTTPPPNRVVEVSDSSKAPLKTDPNGRVVLSQISLPWEIGTRVTDYRVVVRCAISAKKHPEPKDFHI
jgi:hypothetical protein